MCGDGRCVVYDSDEGKGICVGVHVEKAIDEED